MNDRTLPQLYTIDDVCKASRIGKTVLRAIVSELGLIPGRRSGKILFSFDQVMTIQNALKCRERDTTTDIGTLSSRIQVASSKAIKTRETRQWLGKIRAK